MSPSFRPDSSSSQPERTLEWHVPGEAPTWLGAGEKEWIARLGKAVRLEPPAKHLSLSFRVASYLRSGHRFDLDNMVTPVFTAVMGKRNSSARSALEAWTASRTLDGNPGLSLRVTDIHEPTTGQPTVVMDATFAGALPRDSREGGAAFVEAIADVLGAWHPATSHRFAIRLSFGTSTRDITWVEEFPIKPVIDCLYPLLGGGPGVPDDWKIEWLRIERGALDHADGCAVKAWLLDPPAGSSMPTAKCQVKRITTTRTQTPHTRSAAMTNFECLDEVAKALGSPPAEVRIDDLLRRAGAMFPHMASVKKDSASATMDFQTINIRGRASRTGNFHADDRWNRAPAFIKVRRGVWRRLSEEERTLFAALWGKGERLLRMEAYDESDWERLKGGAR